MLIRFSPIILPFLLTPVPAQYTTTWAPIDRTVRYEFRLMNPSDKPSGAVDIYMPLPWENGRQETHYLQWSKRGFKKSFTDRHGQRLVHYHFPRLAPGEFVETGFLIGLTLRHQRWARPDRVGAVGSPTLTAAEKKLYLQPQTNYSMDSPLMQAKAASLCKGATTDYDKVCRIHDSIINKIRYVRDSTWDPAATVLARGTGSCSEYNYVLSGLCRLAGLPTRFVGGSSSGMKPPPSTDVVFHRWTEVFLGGIGWFPVDCSRDGNPLRGPRSHFGRVHNDALVWCRQGGGDQDYLGWEYRVNYRLTGNDPGLRSNHRTRWLQFIPEHQVKMANNWWQAGAETEPPRADILETIALHWHEGTTGAKVKLIKALAGAGRNSCLRRAGGLTGLAPEKKKQLLLSLAGNKAFGATLEKQSRNLHALRRWFRRNETRFQVMGKGRFILPPGKEKKPDLTGLAPANKWATLARSAGHELLQKFAQMQLQRPRTVITPVLDRRPIGARLPGTMDTLLGVVDKGIKRLDATKFNAWLEKNGFGHNGFWAFAVAGPNPTRSLPAKFRPEVILVPILSVDKGGRFRLEIKGLGIRGITYFKVVQQG